MTTVRCKFTCRAITKRAHWDAKKGYLWDAEFQAVTGGKSQENASFFEATPDGTLTVRATRHDLFEVGREYYLDLTLAVPEPAIAE